MNSILPSATILVVDDDEAEIELVSMAIDCMGGAPKFRIDSAQNGLAALDYLHRRGNYAERPAGLPVLVILDNKMPVMGGVEALAEIRKHAAYAALPIVMFTASANEKDIASAYASGVNSYVVKPMSPKGFKDTVQSIVDYWTRINTTNSRSDVSSNTPV
jgi:CheY-like chemotaxis protein